MVLLLLLSAPAAAAPVPAASAKVDAIDFDLARIKPVDPAADCDRSGGSDIVVCGRRQAYAYPLGKMAEIYEAKRLRAETGIGGGTTANVHVEQVTMPDGRISKRLMAGVKIGF